jgi:DNA mismatch repair ATPase MutS
MFLDSATLRDLEILPAAGTRGTTLWTLLNRTRSRVGSLALRERLLNPSSDPAVIVECQRAQGALHAASSEYRRVLDEAAVDEVEKYLAASWQLPNEMPPFLRFRKWYSRYVADLTQGRLLVSSLLASAASLAARLASAEPSILRTHGGEMTALLNTPALSELRRVASQPSPASLFRCDELARGDAKASLTDLLQCIGRAEALWSVAAATAEHGWVYPRPSSRLRITGLFHPYLGRDAVCNDLHLDDKVRVCFVTGPNMAGKSTFLKAAAVAVLLAHAGAGIPAASMEFVPVSTLFSSVKVEDDLSGGESFYLAEVRRVGALASALASTGSAFAVVDEPFRGTNVHDAAEATLAIVTRLAAHPAALALVASHVAEVVPAITADPRIRLLCFAADMTGDRPRFDYRLRAGVCDQRLGMTLLRPEGVLERLERSVSTAGQPPGAPSE